MIVSNNESGGIMKIRFIEPGNLPYRRSIKNLYVYDKYIRTPSQGAMTLATIVNQHGHDVKMYSESISRIIWDDVMDADIVFISCFTFNANRGYELAQKIKAESKAIVVMGGLHITLNPSEAIQHCDYLLIGEGDETIVQFIQGIEKHEPITFPGVVYMENGQIINTGMPNSPQNIDVIPSRDLVYNFKKMTGHNTIWPQVHASRGCPYNCDYCALVAAFGRQVRVRSPKAVVEDIKQAIEFFDEGNHRIAKMLWITDDNFFANREWAIEVLNLIIEEKIQYHFTIQARYEVGYDDEMLELLKKAGFNELALGIEFLEDESFQTYNKKSSYQEILDAVKNIQSHGMRARGLFIFGADNHTVGVGKRLADFVIKHDISGVLIQSMYFIPGTQVYETHKDSLIESDNWSRCTGKVVHYPKNISAIDLQKEIITASRMIYSRKRLINALLFKKGMERLLFVGEYFWQKDVRNDLRKDLKYLKNS